MDAHTMKIHYSLFSTCNIAPNVSMQIFLFYGYRKCDEAVTAHFTEKHYNDVKRVYWALSKLATDNNKIQMGKKHSASCRRIGITSS